MSTFHCLKLLLVTFWASVALCKITSAMIYLLMLPCSCPSRLIDFYSLCMFVAPVPVGGAEEAAVAGHGADHPAGQQLVSALLKSIL